MLSVDYGRNPKDYQAAPIQIIFRYEIPDYAMDMHTIKGRAMGRDVFYFLNEASKVEPLWEDYDDSYRQTLYKMCEEEAKKKEEE